MPQTPVTLVPLPQWLQTQSVRRVFDALSISGAAPRFVGGSVRDMLLGTQGSDIDMATVLFPEEVIELLEKADIKAIPTGITHGTITAICNGQPFEITTLRKDMSCNGRHAEVVFTDDWQEDAARRDFTINAMSCTLKGELYDYFGGQEDLAASRVRFVGDPFQRVQEDYLRILRFFRFSTYFGQGFIDPEGLEACAAHKESLPSLSGERVWQEWRKLLMAPDPIYILTVMAQRGIIEYTLGTSVSQQNITHLTTLCGIDAAPIEAMLRLAILLDGTGQDARTMQHRLKCSNAEADLLAALLSPTNQISARFDERAQKSLLRRQGKENFIRFVCLAWARDPKQKSVFDAMHRLAQSWPIPEFPLRGKDILALGVEPGEQVGKLLALAETYWEEGNYTADHATLVAWVKTTL
jgi:poly(A) polymerase